MKNKDINIELGQNQLEATANQQQFENQQIETRYDQEQIRKSRHKRRQQSKKTIVSFTVFMITNCLVLETFWLHDNMKNNMFEYTLSMVFMYFDYILDMISYYQIIFISSKPVKRPPPPIQVNAPEFEYKNNAYCLNCANNFKPERTHHCSQCGQCNLRMDHHCPWAITCVSQGNNKAFYLFCFYMMLGSAQYCYRAISYFLYLLKETNRLNIGLLDLHSVFFYIDWILVTLLLGPVCCMLAGLTYFHTKLMIKNATTIDLLVDVKDKCYANQKQKVKNVNIFDRGVIANLRNYFASDLFFFWLPTEILTENDGTCYPKHPTVTPLDILKFEDDVAHNRVQLEHQKMDKIYNEEGVPDIIRELNQKKCQVILPTIEKKSTKSIPKNLGKLLDDAKQKYLNVIFQFNYKIFNYWEINLKKYQDELLYYKQLNQEHSQEHNQELSQEHNRELSQETQPQQPEKTA